MSDGRRDESLRRFQKKKAHFTIQMDAKIKSRINCATLDRERDANRMVSDQLVVASKKLQAPHRAEVLAQARAALKRGDHAVKAKHKWRADGAHRHEARRHFREEGARSR